MNFLPDVYVPCEVCHGARYNRETLEVHYKGKTIADVLDMPIEEAVEFFEAIPAIARHLRTLVDVGLGLRPPGSAGADAVRRRGAARQARGRAAEASDRAHGLRARRADHRSALRGHPQAARRAAAARRHGNSVIVIEHNLDVIKTADWVIDMGPEGGSGGGTLVAEGTPEEVAAHPDSYTGQFLKPLLEGREAKQPSIQPALDVAPAGRTRKGSGRTASAKAARASEREAARDAAAPAATPAKKAPAKKATAQEGGGEEGAREEGHSQEGHGEAHLLRRARCRSAGRRGGDGSNGSATIRPVAEQVKPSPTAVGRVPHGPVLTCGHPQPPRIVEHSTGSTTNERSTND